MTTVCRQGVAVPSETAVTFPLVLRDPNTLRDARAELPPNFSAAADRMLLRVPEPAALSRIQLSTPWSAR
jgi:hypothetical protein